MSGGGRGSSSEKPSQRDFIRPSDGGAAASSSQHQHHPNSIRGGEDAPGEESDSSSWISDLERSSDSEEDVENEEAEENGSGSEREEEF